MAKKHHVTMRGAPIDMAAIVAKHGEKRALGNASMNARGDLLGKGGIVLKTQEQIEADWAAEKAKQELTAGLSSDIKAPINIITPGAPQQKQLNVDDANFDPSKPASPSNIPPKARRKIVDTDQ